MSARARGARGVLQGQLALLLLGAAAVAAGTACGLGARYGWQGAATPPPPGPLQVEATAGPPQASPTPTQPPEGQPAPAEGQDPAALGQSVAQEQGCLACHSPDGGKLAGPTWKGVFGSQESLAGGGSVTVDEGYIRESIVDPGAKLVEGYQNIMPPGFGQRLSDREIDALIAYIRSLR